ncbi:hypothetical protein C8F01DRAFT_1083269 [Mycena amicta]|nr:hypothetical protein C8F01DRAFT_1083269 [Mycena amicta]
MEIPWQGSGQGERFCWVTIKSCDVTIQTIYKEGHEARALPILLTARIGPYPRACPWGPIPGPTGGAGASGAGGSRSGGHILKLSDFNSTSVAPYREVSRVALGCHTLIGSFLTPKIETCAKPIRSVPACRLKVVGAQDKFWGADLCIRSLILAEL